MRIVFFNIQINKFFLKPFCDIVLRKPDVSKNRYILDYLLNEDIEVCNFITNTGSTMPGFIRNKIRSLFLIKLETWFVFFKNHLPNKQIKIITCPNQLNDNDLLFFFLHTNFKEIEILESIRWIKIVDLIHFYGLQAEIPPVRKCHFQYYLFEVNLAKYSRLFQKNYLPWFTAEYIMQPYSFKPRFKKIKSFEQRKNKAFVPGTLTFCNAKEFVKTYDGAAYQPSRKRIYDNQDNLSQYLDCFISKYNEKNLKTISKQLSFFRFLYNQIYNDIHGGKQKKYYSFNIVEKYNDYKMFVSTEDVNGSYGVGTFEGMACGTAMIGINSGIFEDLGMVAYLHYIPYDGSLESLCKVIEYYQKNETELKKIAEAGYQFVMDNFTEEKSGGKFYRSIQKIYCDEKIANN